LLDSFSFSVRENLFDMKAPNHVVGGLLFTGFFSAMLGWNLFSSKILIAATVLFSLLPDIDTPASIIGRMFKPISRKIYRRYGHRTITHSLPCLIGVAVSVGFVNSSLLHIDNLTATVFVAYFSHILFDMVTVSGVEFMYPFRSEIFVMPSSPQLRIRVNNLRQESVVMCVFLLSFVGLKPLMSNGFWTSYNSLFGTQKHLYSEFVKSDRLIEATYQIRSGSERYIRSGFVIQANATKSILLDDHGVFEIPDKLEIVENVSPRKSDSTFVFKKLEDLVFKDKPSAYLDLELLCNDKYVDQPYSLGLLVGEDCIITDYTAVLIAPATP